MNPIQFPEQNTTYAKDQPEYFPLPAYRVPDDPNGTIVICWSVPVAARLKLLFTGKLWHEVLTFNRPLQPQKVSVDKPAMT